MRVLALDGALARCSAAVLADDAVLAARAADGERGHAAVLPVLAQEVLAAGGEGAIGLVAVTVGPGGFTGLRAALALAHGFALGAGCPLVGVSVGEALADALADPLADLGGRVLWVAVDSRRGHVILERGGNVESVSLACLPAAPGPIALAGDAAEDVAARLCARGDEAVATAARLPSAPHVGRVGLRRFRGELPPRSAQPLYVDPPATRLPAAPPRPPPLR